MSVNDSVYSDIKYYFYTHPTKGQKGLITMLRTEAFIKGENVLVIKKKVYSEKGEVMVEDFTKIPCWVE